MSTALQPLPRIIMSFFLVTCCCITYAQWPTLTEKIKIHLAPTTAQGVIEALDKQSSYSFTFATEQLSPIVIPAYKAESITLGEAMLALQKEYGLQFTVAGANIIVKPGQKPIEKKQPSGGIIAGKVVDFENGDPLVGATVSLEGLSRHTLTDEKGQYKMGGIYTGTYALVVTYVGYKKEKVQNIKVADDNTT